MVPPILLAHALRFLTIDAVQQAGSGHPGMPMGMADIAVALWKDHLRHHPSNPHWFNRDRFILSNGHGSMLLYALLHLTGYSLSLDDLKQFRQWRSKTPGHPEYRVTPGVESTTGPLGQGLANAVGFALAEQLLAAEFNRPNFSLIDHFTYVFVGDGCLMEGVSHEVCSLAGTWKLGKLIVLYDNNHISIDGLVDPWFTDDTVQRFNAYGWQVLPDIDGHDSTAVSAAIGTAQRETTRPTLICCKTIIAWGAPTKKGTHESHGAPLGAEEIAATRAALGWEAPPFAISDDIREAWDTRPKGAALEAAWEQLLARYRQTYPDLAEEFERRTRGLLPSQWEEQTEQMLSTIVKAAQSVATRKASQQAIETFSSLLPELIGGSADLTSSNLTGWKAAEPVKFRKDQPLRGNYIHYGVREFGMFAIINGLSLHGGFRPFGGTFLVFSDYARSAIRSAALMQINPIFVLTHDSIGLGEDGPTHQPIEHLTALRAMPNLDVWRPADSVESFVAWQLAVESADHPTVLVFSRQSADFLQRSALALQDVRRGGYLLKSPSSPIQAVLIATGTEVGLAVQVQRALENEGLGVSVVSMPSTFQFDRQPLSYRDAILPPKLPRIVIETGASAYWYKYVGLEGEVIGIDCFGESAPAEVLLEHFGFTVSAVKKRVLERLGMKRAKTINENF